MSSATAFTVTVVANPTITLGASPSVCSGSTSSSLPYTATTGSPNQFSINYDATAEGQGFVDVGLSALPISPISLVVPGGAAASTYNATITVRTVGGCVSSATAFTVTVVANPTITLGANPSVCRGVTSANLTYSATTNSPDQYSIDFNAAANAAGFADIVNAILTVSPIVITVPGAAAAAVYSGSLSVRNNVAGCVSGVSAITVTINALPTASISGSNTICSGSSANLQIALTGTGSWDFTYSTTDSGGTNNSSLIGQSTNPFPISVSPTENTTYTMVFVSDANCTGTITGASVTVNVDNPPDITLPVSAGVSPLCSGGSTTVDVGNSENGVSYQLRDGLTSIGGPIVGNGATINLLTGALITTTTFNVLATRGVCPPLQLTNNTVIITVAAAINAGLTVTPQAATLCSGSSTNIQVAASENGVTYQLRDNSNNANIGAAVLSAGGNIDLPTGNLNISTTFNILASNGVCSVQLTSLATVNVDINPTAGLPLAATIDPLCSGGSSAITVTGSEIGVSYRLRDNLTPVGAAVAGTGAVINLPTGSLAATTTFNVLATGGATCAPVQLTSTVMITVAGSIDASLVVSLQNPTICSGSGTNIQIANSEVGVDYQLRDDSNDSNIGLVVSGTGGSIDLPTGILASAKTFNVLASNATCSIELTTLATVNVDINPNLGLATTASIDPVCSGGSSSITVAGSEAGVSYQLRDDSNDSNIGSAVVGTGGIISLPTGALAITTTFNVLASRGVCTPAQLTSTVTVNVGAGVINTGLTITAQSAAICSDTSTNIQIAVSEAGVNYQLRNDLNDALIDTTVPGTGATINLPTGNLFLNTTFNVLASNGTCSIEMVTLPSVAVIPLPDATLGVSAQSAGVCTGVGTNVLVAISEIEVSYQLRDNSDNTLIGVAVVGTASTINLPTGNLIAAKTFNVVATGISSCSVQLTTTASVTILLASDPLCGGVTGTCATVVVVPKPSPATCTSSNGKIVFSIKPFVPTVNNTGVKIDIQGVSATNLAISRTNFNDSTFLGLAIGTYDYTIEYGDVTCVKSGQVTITQSGTVGIPVASNIVNSVCFGQATGSLTLDVPGETGNLLEWSLDGVTWTKFTAGNVITGVPAGAAPLFERVISVRRNSADLCNAAVIVVIQEDNPVITATVSPIDATCANNDGNLVISSIGGGTGIANFTYALNGAVIALPGDNTITGLSSGTYTFSIIDNVGCQIDFAAVDVKFPGFVNHTTPVVVAPDCTGSGSNGSITFQITDVGTFEVGFTVDPVAEPTNYFNTGGTSVSIANLTNGSYYIWIKSSGSQCVTKLLPVSIDGTYSVDFASAATNVICFGDNAEISLTAITGAPDLDFKFELVKDGVTSSGTISVAQSLSEFKIQDLVPGNYQVRLTQNQSSVVAACTTPIASPFQNLLITGPAEALDTLYVNRVISFPDLATGSILLGIKESEEEPYEVRLELTQPLFPSQSFVLDWTAANRNPQNLKVELEIKNLYAGDYQLSLRDVLGCVKDYTITLNVDTNIFVPNVFTPNGDGVNDVFYIRNLPDDANLIITNRWGKEVFSSGNYQNDWTGGEIVDGVYFYRLGLTGESITGWIEIMRGK